MASSAPMHTASAYACAHDRVFVHEIDVYDFDGVANAGGGNINFSSRHIANFKEPKDALFELVGVLIHETTHLYQFDAGGGGLVEGMADFVRIRAGHHRMNRRVKGGAWTDPYTTSGFFFSWLAGPGGLQADGRPKADPDIGWAINQAMGGSSFDMQVFSRTRTTAEARQPKTLPQRPLAKRTVPERSTHKSQNTRTTIALR